MDHNYQCSIHALCFVFWCQLPWHPLGAQFCEQQVFRDNFVQQGAGNECWHSWRCIWIGAMLCASKNFIRDRTSQSVGAGIGASIFNHCNDARSENSGRPASVCVILHHYCITYRQSLHAINYLIDVGLNFVDAPRKWLQNKVVTFVDVFL